MHYLLVSTTSARAFDRVIIGLTKFPVVMTNSIRLCDCSKYRFVLLKNFAIDGSLRTTKLCSMIHRKAVDDLVQITGECRQTILDILTGSTRIEDRNNIFYLGPKVKQFKFLLRRISRSKITLIFTAP